MNKKRKLPELLAPAGSPEALAAAIEAGADAVYFGGEAFSNRMRAKNFDSEEIKEAIRLCAGYGVASHITLNTRLRDRELWTALDTARELWAAGASAFIVADVGFAKLLTREIPGVVLHGSTQLTGVSPFDAEALASLGFSRMVCPRELSREELSRLINASPVEIEMFIHGALCVSVSGQCLMSWAQGGRSGNRGECAQPCRLPYSLNGRGREHLLSLKDSCLAEHIPEMIGLGPASLKIEGRMKGADYVYGVTRIYRRLLDEGRGATAEELRELDSLFSRDGFTDGYFTGKMHNMNGMRPEGSSESEGAFAGLSRKVPLKAELCAPVGGKLRLTLTDGELSVSVTGGEVSAAERAPATAESAFKNISRFGGTPFSLSPGDFELLPEGEAFLPASALNELRRKATEALTEKRAAALRDGRCGSSEAQYTRKSGEVPRVKYAEFAKAESIPSSAREFFDAVFLPFDEIKSTGAELALPPWQADPSDTARMLESHRAAGGRMALCHTLGQIRETKRAGLSPVASFRLNVTNAESAKVMASLGADYTVLSPELPVPAMRDIASEVHGCGAVAYGRLPLMLLRRCILEPHGCSGRCGDKGCAEGATLTDRRGGALTVLSAGEGTNVLLNSHTLWSADRQGETSCLDLEYFIFTTENADETEEVIAAYRAHLSPEAAGKTKIKRM